MDYICYVQYKFQASFYISSEEKYFFSINLCLNSKTDNTAVEQRYIYSTHYALIKDLNCC